MPLTAILSGVSLTNLELHVAVQRDDGSVNTHTFDLLARSTDPDEYQKPLYSAYVLTDWLEKLKAKGYCVCATLDTYLYLVRRSQYFSDAHIDFVFPWPADMPCLVVPPNARYTDWVSRYVACYYAQMAEQWVMDWQSVPRQFVYKANNTISLRSYAAYQNQTKQNRGLMRPLETDAAVLQFDWRAAEWRLCAANAGYSELPQDAYEPFLDLGERGPIKDTVLRYIYGSALRTLYKEHTQPLVDAVVQRLHDLYPKVITWSRAIREVPSVDFCGFQIDLGEEKRKRANRFCQTALQLCKHDLIFRLSQVGAGEIASGDLHDSLYFHVKPCQIDIAHAAIQEIRKPCFQKISLPAEITHDHCWH